MEIQYRYHSKNIKRDFNFDLPELEHKNKRNSTTKDGHRSVEKTRNDSLGWVQQSPPITSIHLDR